MNELIEMIKEFGAQNVVVVCGVKHHKEVLDVFKNYLADVACVIMVPDEETLYFVLEEDLDNIPVHEIENEFENWVSVPFDDVMDRVNEFYAIFNS